MRFRSFIAAAATAAAVVAPVVTPTAHAVPTTTFVHTSAGFRPASIVATSLNNVVVENADTRVAPTGVHTYQIQPTGVFSTPTPVRFGTGCAFVAPFRGAAPGSTFTLVSDNGDTATITVVA